MSNLTSIHGGNITLINNSDLCTLQTCDLSLANTSYLPSVGGNAFFAAVFGICIVTQFFLGFRHRTWGYMVAVTLGLLGEIVGYAGRILMHHNPFSKNNFLLYLVPLTIAPALLSAGIYLCLARIVIVYGPHLSRVRPRTYTIVFCLCDFLSLLLQAIGGAIASISNTQSTVSDL
jgi:hypothetical protein